jgi:RNA processing factor Prp31
METTEKPEIVHTDGGTVITGDGMTLYRWGHLRVALQLYNKNGMLMTRGATMKFVLAQVTEITRKPYKNSVKDREQAIIDLTSRIDALKAQLNIVDERKKP